MNTSIHNFYVKNFARRFTENTAGVAAIEFALIAPIMILMAIGTFEIGRAVIVHKRLQRATDMVADLVSREQTLGDTSGAVVANLDGIMRAAENALYPYDTTKLRMSILSVRANIPANPQATPTTSIEWSYGYKGSPHQQCPAPKSLPQAGMVVAGNAVIMVESEYDYSPLLNYGGTIKNTFNGTILQQTFKDTMVYAPRNTCVDVLKRNCIAQCSFIN